MKASDLSETLDPIEPLRLREVHKLVTPLGSGFSLLEAETAPRLEQFEHVQVLPAAPVEPRKERKTAGKAQPKRESREKGERRMSERR